MEQHSQIVRTENHTSVRAGIGIQCTILCNYVSMWYKKITCEPRPKGFIRAGTQTVETLIFT